MQNFAPLKSLRRIYEPHKNYHVIRLKIYYKICYKIYSANHAKSPNHRA